MSVLNINIEELLKELDPATLQALEQLLAEDAPAVRKTIQNILDEPISEKVEKSLDKPLIPKTFQPTAPSRRRGRKTQEILRKFDPITRDNIRNVSNYQNEILDLYNNIEYKGEEVKGRRFIRWRFIRGLERDLTPDLMTKIREKVKTSFYARHIFSYQLRNIEEDSSMVMYTNKGSPWFERFSDAEKWLSERKKVRLDPDNINRLDTKWVFENQWEGVASTLVLYACSHLVITQVPFLHNMHALKNTQNVFSCYRITIFHLERVYRSFLTVSHF